MKKEALLRIADILKRQGIQRDRLEAALRQPLPAEVRTRVLAAMAEAGG
ncbi:hypothetical protein SAMN04487970_102148 [Paenibacillus tianmuensis]|uniref:Uncharacterized protein n=1 Tax=Paenibacillus tianmuensis TaxID=624147 RepID=A0A1G4S0R0_9BACL|nr:hypothetical protein [Paenibacillus tianmuensis]SCW62275.1 hypothetical protein SAMN04487970_102148 [Paenibacillus tianmuensis]